MTAKTSAGRSLGPTPCVPKGRSIFTQRDWRKISEALSLSDREFEIVQAIFDDEKERVIAEELGISCHTVHTHIGRLYHKLGVHGRCELVVRLFAEHVILSSSRGHGHEV